MRSTAAATIAATMAVIGETPFLALGHRYPHSLKGRDTIAEALFRHRTRHPEGAPLFARLNNGLRMSVPPSREGASISLAGCLMGEDEAYIHAMYSRFLQPGDVFFDVGSHLGFYSLVAAGLTAPDGQIHTFDAQDWIIGYLDRSRAENGLQDRMHINHNAVLASDGDSVTIYPSRDGVNTGAASIMHHGWVDTEHGRTVDGVSLDAYAVRNGVTRIDAMKIDVEGAEFGVLQGMKAIFAATPPRLVMIELMIDEDGLDSAATAGAKDAMALMAAQGYESHDILPDGRLGAIVGHADLSSRVVANIGFAYAGLRNERPDMFAN